MCAVAVTVSLQGGSVCYSSRCDSCILSVTLISHVLVCCLLTYVDSWLCISRNNIQTSTDMPHS